VWGVAFYSNGRVASGVEVIRITKTAGQNYAIVSTNGTITLSGNTDFLSTGAAQRMIIGGRNNGASAPNTFSDFDFYAAGIWDYSSADLSAAIDRYTAYTWSDNRSLILVDGNSITSPGALASDEAHQWISVFEAELVASGHNVEVLNKAQNGQDVTAMIADAVSDLDRHYSSLRRCVSVQLEIGNDLTNYDSASGTLSRTKEYSEDRKAKGFRTVVLTCPPRDFMPTLNNLINEIFTDQNAHVILTTGTVHGAADSANVVSALTYPSAVDEATRVARINALRAAYVSHIATIADDVHLEADETNVLTVPEAEDDAGALLLAVELKLMLNAHGADTGPHTIADATNVVTSTTPVQYNINIVNDAIVADVSGDFDAKALLHQDELIATTGITNYPDGIHPADDVHERIGELAAVAVSAVL
jgi:hypothetical protein